MIDLNGVTNNVPGCLPCPFCGGTEIHIQIFSEGVDHAIACSACFMGRSSGNFYSDAEAVVAWNTRAESSENAKLRGERDAAREERDQFDQWNRETNAKLRSAEKCLEAAGSLLSERMMQERACCFVVYQIWLDAKAAYDTATTPTKADKNG